MSLDEPFHVFDLDGGLHPRPLQLFHDVVDVVFGQPDADGVVEASRLHPIIVNIAEGIQN